MSPMLTSQQLAAQLNISTSTIRLYAREHLIPFVETPGGHRRYDIDDVRAALTLIRPAKFPHLSSDASPRLAHAAPVRFSRVHGWETITEADLQDGDGSGAGRPSAIPMIG